MEVPEVIFWKNMENFLKCTIPSHLKCIIERAGFVNPALEDLTEREITGIESDVRGLSELANLPVGDPLLRKYLGKYIEKPKDFKLMSGERALLLKIAGAVKAKSWPFFVKNKSQRSSQQVAAKQADVTDEVALITRISDYFESRYAKPKFNFICPPLPNFHTQM
ncbi:uncharacterized protein LOC134206205 [Armigeres subalbatus]|uniref:uncharacterized protein LOC134206205 n=1 Tax=Armigeres subalbatus TaxID=124917 RepID=UPI002ED1338D